MRLSSQLGCGAFALLLLASGCDAQSCSSVQVPITSCTASSAYPGYGCQNAYDGNAATEWATNNQAVGATITLNFGAPYNVGKIEYANRDGASQAIKAITLTFNDASTVVVDNLNVGITPKVATFPARATSAVVITVSQMHAGAGGNIGSTGIKFSTGCPSPPPASPSPPPGPQPPPSPAPAPPYTCPPGPCASWCHNYNSNDARCSGCYHNEYCDGVNSRCDSWCSAWTCSSKSPMLGHIPFFADHCNGCSFCKTEDIAKKVTASYG